MKTSHSRLLLTLLGLLACVPLCAAPEGKASPPWYEVEILIFARHAAGAGGTEHWVADPEPPDWSGSTRPERYPQVPGSGRRLGPAAYSLKRSGARLEPLIHKAWRQPVTGPSRAPDLYLQSKQGTASGKPEVEGVLRISVNRYLHVDLDFLLRRPVNPEESVGQGSGAEQAYRFTAHRRMRSGELHYIDHPLIGVLIQISPYQRPRPEIETGAPPAAAESPAAGSASTGQQAPDPAPASAQP